MTEGKFSIFQKFLLINLVKMKKYKEYKIFFDPFIPDLVSGFLWELDITGLNEEENFIKIFSEEKNLSLEIVSNQLQKLVREKVIDSFKIEENIFEDKNWNEEWERSINVIEISDRIIIKPSFRNYEPKKSALDGQIIITIDPKMSFGTGEHPTTKLVLQLLEKYVQKNSKVLDIGTGTGILSIASIKLGADFVLAIDNDEWCIENSKENIKLNNVEDKIEVQLAEINQIRENNFDLILANIQKNVLLDIAEEIMSKLKKEGFVILSGLLAEDENDILKKYKELSAFGGFSFVETKQSSAIGGEGGDEWIGVVFQKR